MEAWWLARNSGAAQHGKLNGPIEVGAQPLGITGISKWPLLTFFSSILSEDPHRREQEFPSMSDRKSGTDIATC